MRLDKRWLVIGGLDRAIADGEAHGFVTVLTVPGKDRILGVTIVGEHAGAFPHLASRLRKQS